MQNTINLGFILSRQCQDQKHGLLISLWLATETGPVKLEIRDQHALFFIETSQVQIAQQFLQQDNLSVEKITNLPLKTFNQAAVSCLYFKYMRDFYRARDLLKQVNIKCYEDDIRPDERYLMERFITAGIQYQGQVINKQNYQVVVNAQCKAIEVEQSLSMLSIDIECSRYGELYSIGAYADAIKKVFMVGQQNVSPSINDQNINETDEYITYVPNETALLQTFILWLNEVDPDIIIGWNVIQFDFDLLQKRCDLYKIPFAIGRDKQCVYWRNNMNSEQKFITIAGRVVLDGIDLMKNATYSFPSFSLDYVANKLLGIGKKVDDVDNRLAEITHDFKHNKAKLAAYNLEDCRLVWLIFEKEKLLTFAQLRAHLTGLSIDRIGGSVAAFTNLYLPKLHRAGYVAPNMGDGEQGFVSPGGYVMDSIPGLYNNVLVLDFKSLYPSIIRTFSIDPMGLIEGLQESEQLLALETLKRVTEKKEDQKLEKQKELAPDTTSPIAAYDGAYFSREKHFLPDIIASLWQERDKAKADNNAVLSQAIKIIMNSFYGILGSTGCRFFDPRLSGAITKRSHDILKTTQKWLEAEFQYKVIYGDTDSIFVDIGEQENANVCRDIGYKLQDFINAQWQQTITEQYQVTSYLDIEFETHFSKFLMPTIRGLDIGTKKRYAGLISHANDQSKDNIVFKGLESVRTDWTELAKKFQGELYFKVFHEQPVVDYVIDMVNKTYSGEFDELLIYRKRIRRKLKDYVKNVPPHVKAARAADEINRKNNKPLRYQNKGWIEYLLTTSGPQAKEHCLAAIDYQFYVDRQLKAVADAILPFIDTSFDQITNNQLNLFE